MHITTKKSTRIIFAPLIKLTEYIGVHHPRTLIKIRYFARFRKFPNFKKPKDLNEKILWLELFSDTSMWSLYADKFKVRKYIEECGLENYLVNLYGHYYNCEDFNLEQLPNSFILKANNGNGKGSNLIVENKNDWKEQDLKKNIDRWLKTKNIGALSAELHYQKIVPCVLAEELLPIEDGSKSLIDYKIWCFNGKAFYIWTCSNRDNYGTEVMMYDINWNPKPEVCIYDSRYRKGTILPKPDNIEEMIFIAESLAKPFPEVRMDFYNVNGRICFGEITLTSLGGMMDFYSSEFLLEMGDKVDIKYKG